MSDRLTEHELEREAAFAGESVDEFRQATGHAEIVTPRVLENGGGETA